LIDYNDLKIEKQLGKGGSGVVNKGWYKGQEVAIKELYNLSNGLNDFARECEIQSSLQHPNVVSLFGVCMTPKLLLVSEFMHKGSLKDVLDTHSALVTLYMKCQFLLGIAKGMQYLHSKGILHRDLKTDNCLVNDEWICKVCDFGVSKTIPADDSGYTTCVPQSLLWMAPELHLGKGKSFSKASDVYSFGIVMWECLTELEPYGEYSDQADHDLIRLIVLGTRPTIPDTCPPWFRQLMCNCWSKKISQRPSYDEIVECVVNNMDQCKYDGV